VKVVTSTERGRVTAPVHLFVCQLNKSKSYEQILMTFFVGVASGPRIDQSHFGGDLVQDRGQGFLNPRA